MLILLRPVIATERLNPFGLALDQTLYEDTLYQLKQKSWMYEEYERKSFVPVKKDSPRKGRNTFLKVKPKSMEGLRNLYLFFNDRMILEAVIVGLEAQLLSDVKAKLNQKYKLVKDSLLGEDPTVGYAYILWEQSSFYIELQKLSTHNLRLIYVNKTYYENYREFLYKSFGTFRPRKKLVLWLNEL
ncbi:MAG: hypothetical protein PVJ50_09400 [Desulfobacterales bacterium]|jgi:hypothetical protein